MSDDLDLDLDFEIQPCSHHSGYLENKFCKQCEQPICSQCIISEHRDHEIDPVPLKQKIKEEHEKLKAVFKFGKRHVLKAQKRVTEIRTNIENIETSTSQAIGKMTSQLEYVKTQLIKTCELEIEHITTRKSMETQKLEDRSEELQQFVENWKSKEEEAKNMLQPGRASHLVSDISDFLKNSQIERMFSEKQIRIMHYTEPTYRQTADDEIFQKFLRENVLGLFVRQPQDSFSPVETKALLVSCKDVKNNASQLKSFSSALLKGDSLWISGWTKERFWSNSCMTLYYVQIPEYNFLPMQKMKGQQAEKPIIMCASGDSIFVARKASNDLHSFDIRTQQVSTLNPGNVAVLAMCGNADRVYILDNSCPSRINIFDSEINSLSNFATGLEDIEDGYVDMCIIDGDEISAGHHENTADHIIIISTSFPQASVRAISEIEGFLWQLDCQKCPHQLDLSFNPCSVTASKAGDIFIADRRAEKVNILILLAKDITNIFRKFV